jgi:hypothetical protein
MFSSDPAAPVAARFLVLADATPGLMPRLLQPFAKRDLTPDAMRATREGGMMRAEFALHEVESGYVHLIAGNLGQVVGVRSVQTLLSEAEEDRRRRAA